jgi:protocatechuate 3,4-dioxygenase beta subunit
MTSTKNSRRQFLRNTALATVSAGIFPSVVQGTRNQAKVVEDCNLTTLDYYGQGPFYTPAAPIITNNRLADENEPGKRLILSGIVKTLDCSKVIANAAIDLWQADATGQYDNTGFKLHGVTYSNDQGYYLIETILPGKYLNGASYRPSHIHFKITPPGFPTLTTQLYFQGDEDIRNDAAASIKSGHYDASHRTIPVVLNTGGKYEATWDIIINGDGLTSVDSLHLDKGILYSVSPNPFADRLTINYGIYQQAKVTIHVFDMKGNMVAKLDEAHLNAEKYSMIWQPDSQLLAGIYWVTLKINDSQVHYLKIVKI